MGKHLYIAIFTIIFCSSSSLGQILDFDRPEPYEKVFVDTDNFGASYLQQLEDFYENVFNFV